MKKKRKRGVGVDFGKCMRRATPAGAQKGTKLKDLPTVLRQSHEIDRGSFGKILRNFLALHFVAIFSESYKKIDTIKN